MENAQWIWLDANGKKDEFGVFYDVFTAAEGRTLVRISCAGDYTLYVNGGMVAFGQYPDFAHYKVYDEIDITPFVRSGENECKIVAWNYGEDFSTHREDGAGLIYEITQLGKVLCFSHEGTACALAPDYVSYGERKITKQLGYSYTYDMRKKDTVPQTHPAVKVRGFDNLYPRPVKKLSVEPTALGKCIDAEKRLYDIGKECSGFLHIRFRAKAGTKIKVAYGEHIVDGQVRYAIGDRDFSVDLIASGNADTFLGTFRRLGGRYLQILCDDEVQVEFIGIAETPYPVIKRGYAEGNALRRRIYDTCVRTLELCMHEHYEDTPWREQSLYIMDGRNQMLCGYYAFDNAEFAAASIALILQGQKENGLFELCFPARVDITIPYFSLILPMALREYYEHTGDKKPLRKAVAPVQKVFGFFESRMGDGLFKTESEQGIWNFYDWAGNLDGAFFSADENIKVRNEYDSIINCHLSLAYKNFARICSALGRAQQADKYAAKSEKLNKKIYETFYDTKSGLFRTSDAATEFSELANALAILCGACPKEKRKVIAEKMARGDTDWIKCTLSMNAFKFDAMLLTDSDKYKTAVLDEIDKTYEYMLSKGATSFWETKKGEADFDGAGSLCHGWSAIPVYYYRLLCTDNAE